MAFGNYEFPHSHNYDSDLRELIELVKEIDDNYEEILSTVDALNTSVSEIKSEFEALDAKVDNMFEYIDDEIAAQIELFRIEFNTAISNIEEEITELNQLIEDVYSAAKAYADAKDENVKAVLRAEMAELITKVYERIAEVEALIEDLHYTAINPLTGYEETIDKVVKAISDNYRVHALTNFEYSDLGLTNDEYANYLLYDKQYIIEGKTLLQRKWINHQNPATGMLTTEFNVASWIATHCANTLTADDYAAENLTNEDYAALNLTNEDYFFTQAADLPWQ